MKTKKKQSKRNTNPREDNSLQQFPSQAAIFTSLKHVLHGIGRDCDFDKTYQKEVHIKGWVQGITLTIKTRLKLNFSKVNPKNPFARLANVAGM